MTCACREDIHCAECGRTYRAKRGPQGPDREELLRQAVVEAARAYLAAFLAWEAKRGDYGFMAEERLQDLRDACTAERRAPASPPAPESASWVASARLGDDGRGGGLAPASPPAEPPATLLPGCARCGCQRGTHPVQWDDDPKSRCLRYISPSAEDFVINSTAHVPPAEPGTCQDCGGTGACPGGSGCQTVGPCDKDCPTCGGTGRRDTEGRG